MSSNLLNKAVELSKKEKYSLLATANADGMPHIAIAKGLKLLSDSTIEITGWFCPQTVENLRENKLISLAVWDEESDEGYQFTGGALYLEDIAMLDGYAPELEKRAIPQVEQKITVNVLKVLQFRHAPHSDVEEE